MVNMFYVEFTAEDRISVDPKMRGGEIYGIRLKYQTAKKTEKVNYSVLGFDPFFEYDWLTVVKYENLKGDAVKDLMKPTPVTFSPHGLHVKENWGKLDNLQLIDKTMEDLKSKWLENRTKYDDTLLPPDEDKKYSATRNLLKVHSFLRFLFAKGNPASMAALSSIYRGQVLIPVPVPGEDEFLMEQNSISAHRVEKRAVMGDPDFVNIGDFRVLTFQHSGETKEE